MPDKFALDDYFADLKKRIVGDLHTDEYTRVLYSTDASIYQVKPFGVVFPKSMEDVQASVALAANYKIPVLPRTGGSSLAGQTVNEAVVIDMSRYLHKILEVNIEEKWARVEPGVTLDTLNLHLQPYGLQFGPDPASSDRAAMGGIVANNSTGSHSILYGMTADHLLETHVLLSDGSEAHFNACNPEMLKQKQKKSGLEGSLYQKVADLTAGNAEIILKGTPHHWRRSGGYNLDRFVSGATFNYPQNGGFNLSNLICGSEGTLAIMREIKVSLVARPKMTALGVVQFDSLYEALSATPIILETNPSAVELLNNYVIMQCRKVPTFARRLETFLRGEPDCMLITEYYGESEAELKAKLDGLTKRLGSAQVKAEVVSAIDGNLQKNVWAVRKAGLGLLMSAKSDFKPLPFIEDAAVPPEFLADYVTQIEKFCHDMGTKVAYYAHASAGCIHIRPLINAKIASEVDKLPEIARFSVGLLGKYGGSLSSEHGDGRSRSWLNEYFFGKELYDLYQQTKRLFDPNNIFNPGMIVNAGDMRENLRYGGAYKVNEIQTKYDFSKEQGFQSAVEMCNGAAVCRKTLTGAMCPSFMVTRDEEHSTRGRANALRAALSGQLDFNEFTSKRMFEVMDLCVECKACKAECPSSVDMAKIKFEFLAQYNARHGASLRSRLFGNAGRMSRIICGPAARPINWLNSQKIVRTAIDALVGISKYRELPFFARQSFSKWQRLRSQNRKPGNSKRVALFVDTFNNYHEPAVLIAATEILEAIGYEVLIPEPFCCGRPAISKGLFHEAQKAARNTVDALRVYARQGTPIVGVEPSCLLTLREEFPDLLPDNKDVESIAENSWLIEEFLLALEKKGELNLEFARVKQNLLLHGHCHQKSLVGVEPVKKMLGLPESYNVEEVDSGCCGMAGSFGYEKEHYEISMQMAEHRLLPEIRAQKTETLIAASGFSCRHQIKHGSGKTALHPVQILRQAMLEKQS